MFTGIVERTGAAAGVRRKGRGAELLLRLPASWRLRRGESLAVDGVCLTVRRAGRGRAAFDLSAETLRRTALARLAPGARVNLERPLRYGGRLGGHLVLGHVDGVGRVAALRREGRGSLLRVRAPAGFRRWLLPKGAVAVNGVSLTLARVEGTRFAAALIPVTLAKTNLGLLRPGDRVNLEGDLYLKWLARRGGKRKTRR